jgi:AcrR family transcriptional regulator
VNPVTEPKQARSQATRLKLLDAAVDELVACGYGKLTTKSVAARAGVSRGAQQHHFPVKAALVSEAVQHLAIRQLEEIRSRSARIGTGPARVERILDVLFELYAGPLFAAMIELTLAARGDEELARAVAPIEREVSRGINEQAAELFGPAVVGQPDFDKRLRQAVATIRGLVLLRYLGHQPRTIAAQWRFTRADLARMLTAPG